MTSLRTVTAEMAESSIRNWIAMQTGLHPAAIGGEQQLVGADLLDSFALLSLSGVVEELLGRMLTPDEGDYRNFMSIDVIIATFFANGGRHAA